MFADSTRLGDVIFGERALNYEEGKTVPPSPPETKYGFLPSTNILTTGSERMDGYVTRVNRELYKYGDFISGCALRLDAQEILTRVQKEVRPWQVQESQCVKADPC